MRLKKYLFLSTPSARRATRIRRIVFHIERHFYPRPPRGGRPVRGYTHFPCGHDFYPRPPRGGRLSPSPSSRRVSKFLSTPSARRATTYAGRRHRGDLISIHALREEGDRLRPGWFRPIRYFYPRPPRGGRLAGTVIVGAPEGISIHALREEGDQKNYSGNAGI